MAEIITIIRHFNHWTFDAVVRESHTSELDVTDNPVETGVEVSDHAVKKPERLEIEAVVTNTPLGRYRSADAAHQEDPFASVQGRHVRAYEVLQELQATREPFPVMTGLKLYKNMVVTSLTAEQDADKSQILSFHASLREVIIVDTQTVKYPARKQGKPHRQASKEVAHGEKKTAEDNELKKQESIALSLLPDDLKSKLKAWSEGH